MLVLVAYYKLVLLVLVERGEPGVRKGSWQFAGRKGDGRSGRLTPNDAVQTMAKAAIG